MPASPATVASRRDEIAAWLAPGLDIEIEGPTVAQSTYRASLPEFGLSAEGTSEDEALDALTARLADLLTTYLHRGGPLPDRGAWLAAHPGRPASPRRA